MDKRIQIGLIKAVPEFSEHVPTDSPFSFIASVREHMTGLVQQRLSYIQLDDAEPDRDIHIAYLRQYMKANFSPFHDHLTLLVLADKQVRTKVYSLIFTELAQPVWSGFGGVRRYIEGPLFSNLFFGPSISYEGAGRVTYYGGYRRLRDITPLPRVEHVPYFEVRVAKDRDRRVGGIVPASNILLEVVSTPSEESLAKPRKDGGYDY